MLKGLKSPEFVFRFQVDNAAIDPLGHANNAAYIHWMQEAAIAHSASCGWTVDRYLELGTVWIARSHRIQYLRPLLVNDQVEITTWISAVRRASSTRSYAIRRASDGMLAAEAETDWTFVKLDQLRPCRVPEGFLEDFQIKKRSDARADEPQGK